MPPTAARALAAFRRLTALLPKPVVGSPVVVRASRSSWTDRPGFLASNRAAAAATCGEAMLVPACFL
ncbi:hypothetical protein D3C86_1408810 [compost metagenome]